MKVREPEDWAAMARAVGERMDELGWSPLELAKRSSVARSTIREIQRHVVIRRRNSGTLQSLSCALRWHPNHLEAIVHGQPPQPPPKPAGSLLKVLDELLDTVWNRLDTIRNQLDRLDGRLTMAIDSHQYHPSHQPHQQASGEQDRQL